MIENLFEWYNEQINKLNLEAYEKKLGQIFTRLIFIFLKVSIFM